MKILPDNKTNELTLYCFNPPIMIITFMIEVILALYTFLKSRKEGSTIDITLVLVFLAVFQLAEYQVCLGNNPLIWSRVGLSAITFLPILGYYLISKLENKTRFIFLGAFIALAFAIEFIFFPKTIAGAVCNGNYVIFNMESILPSFWGYYYFGFLLLGLWMSARGILDDKLKAKTKRALRWFIVGYLSFILPLTLVYAFIVPARAGTASIMCGFAIIFAFILTFKIAPVYHASVKSKKYLSNNTKK